MVITDSDDDNNLKEEYISDSVLPISDEELIGS